MIDKGEILDQLFAGERQIPTVPALYTKFNEMIKSQHTSNKEIADLVMKDQSMVAKLLRLCNSAMYAKRKEITDLANAITFLGLETLKNMILQISLVRTFKVGELDIPGFKINTFWEHSLGTAYFVPIICKKLNIPYQEELYLAALLHDIGKLVTFQFYPEEFKEIVLKQIDEKYKCLDAEEEIMGINHCDIGCYFAEKWKFKESIISVIRHHHDQSRGLTPILAIVKVSNMFAKASGLCFPWDSQFFDMIGDSTWQFLSQYTGESIAIDKMVTDIMSESDKVKDSVRELLGE